jgi:hypothetical protein
MSYSFSITAASRDEAGKKVEEQLALVVSSQPSHGADRQAAQDAAEAFINTLTEPGENEQVSVNMSGSLGWRGSVDDGVFTHASINISAAIVSKSV